MKKRLEFFLHNTVNHPLAGLCWLVGAEESGDAVHDASPFEVTASVLAMALVVFVFVVKVPSVQETFAQADAHKAAQEVANGR